MASAGASRAKSPGDSMIAACAQLDAKTMDEAAAVWPGVERTAARAAEAGADLIVFPEVTYPAYWLESADRYRRDDIERTEAVLSRFSELAARHACWLVAGYVEEEGDRLYNSAAVFDRGGRFAGRARKQFMWDCDRKWFAPGEASTVLDTEFGRMGLLICADARMPEITATLACKGARFIVQPTAWVNTSLDAAIRRNIQPEFLIRARAIEFGLPWVCSSKSGREDRRLEYVGLSRIVSAAGESLAEAPRDGDALVTGEVVPAEPRPVEVPANLVPRLLSPEPPRRNPSGPRTCELRPSASAGEMATGLEAAHVRAASVTTNALRSFAVARCHALDGVQVLIAEGPPVDAALVRARAAENCLWLIVAGEATRCVVDPRGAVVWRAGDEIDSLELDVALADAKAFLPTTDIWSQRRVATYHLGSPVDAHASEP